MWHKERGKEREGGSNGVVTAFFIPPLSLFLRPEDESGLESGTGDGTEQRGSGAKRGK